MSGDREPRTREERLAYASEHVRYEVVQLVGSAEELAKANKPVLRNALVEAFGVHLRNLCDFFDGASSEKCFKDPQTWIRARQPKSKAMAEAYQRLHQEILHLGYPRLVDVSKKGWDVATLANELIETWNRFVSLIVIEDDLGELHKAFLAFLKEQDRVSTLVSATVTTSPEPAGPKGLS